jgi:glycosyltransferase involved in cell wall biosynthesis
MNQILNIVGSGPLESSVRESALENPLIRYHGSLVGASLEEVWSRCSVLIAPSIVGESFGLVVAEALARGLFVITGPNGGPTELIVDGETGLVSGGQNISLADAVFEAAKLHGPMSMELAIAQHEKFLSPASVKKEWDAFYSAPGR